MFDYNRIYIGKANPERKGKRCRIVHTWKGKYAIRNVGVEFEDGYNMTTHIRCVRKSIDIPVRRGMPMLNIGSL